MRIVAVEEPGAEIVSDPDGTAPQQSPKSNCRDFCSSNGQPILTAIAQHAIPRIADQSPRGKSAKGYR